MPIELDFVPLIPTFLLMFGGCLLLLSEVFLAPGSDRRYQAALTVGTAAIAGLVALWQLGTPQSRVIFMGAAIADGFTYFITVVICGGLLLSALVAQGFLQRHSAERGEFYALLLFASAGMILLAMSFDLMMLFIALEVMSVATYALAAWLRRGQRPSESAFKYFLLGAFSSALYLYGVALVYGATGSTRIADLAQTTGIASLLVPGIALIAVGFAFKVAAVPFHMWAPDVYEGAPTPVTAFMAAGVKAAAFAAFVRTVAVAFGNSPGQWQPLVIILAGLTMLVGNLLALPQRNVKRMLAYSSIAHAGYLLVALAATRFEAAKVSAGGSMLFYLAAYTFTAVGAFGTVAALERRESDLATAWDLDRFAGLGKRRPVLAF
ncbi:MAG: NADH-quinone oxidoreductase subunit N, partial [Myxococcales bacterium]